MAQRRKHWTIVLNNDEASTPPPEHMDICAPDDAPVSSQSSSLPLSIPASLAASPPTSPESRASAGASPCVPRAPRADALEAAGVLLALTGAAGVSTQIFACPKCRRGFKRKGDLKRHVRRVHEKIRDSVCPTCRKAFGEDYNMRRHVSRVHRNSAWKCNHSAFFRHLELRTLLHPTYASLSSSFSTSHRTIGKWLFQVIAASIYRPHWARFADYYALGSLRLRVSAVHRCT